MVKNYLQILRDKRKEIAAREGRELFMIFSNKTLEDTVSAHPRTIEDLALIKGWGPKKIQRYGQEIIALFGEDNASEVASGTLGLFNDFEASLPEGEEKKHVPAAEIVFSVSECVQVVNNVLARLGGMRVRGEVSELQMRGAAVYFTLKDVSGEEAVVKCVLWKWKFERDFNYLEKGMEIIVSGTPEVYAKYGTFNLRVEKVEPVGEGALQKAFEALKKKLEAKGYFDEQRKRPIPEFIRKIGIITSEAGEAINDFRKNIGEYGFELGLYDVWVEGNYAEESIVKAIAWMNKNKPDLDVLVLIRGGGGLENLKAFNSEAVADAIITSRIPVLTGIGHERDETIAGYSADKNVSTPTAVAVFIRTQHEGLLTRLRTYEESMVYAVEAARELVAQDIDQITDTLTSAFDRLLERQGFAVAKMASGLYNGLGRIFDFFHLLERKFLLVFNRHEVGARETHFELEHLCNRSAVAMSQLLALAGKRIEVAAASLVPLDPSAILKRGYSVAYDEQGHVLKDAGEAKVGKQVTVRMYKGKLVSRVEEIKE